MKTDPSLLPDTLYVQTEALHFLLCGQVQARLDCPGIGLTLTEHLPWAGFMVRCQGYDITGKETG